MDSQYLVSNSGDYEILYCKYDHSHPLIVSVIMVGLVIDSVVLEIKLRFQMCKHV